MVDNASTGSEVGSLAGRRRGDNDGGKSVVCVPSLFHKLNKNPAFSFAPPNFSVTFLYSSMFTVAHVGLDLKTTIYNGFDLLVSYHQKACMI